MSGTTSPGPRGLDGVVAVRTRLSHVDGLAGELIIGGYELKELAGRVTSRRQRTCCGGARAADRGSAPGSAPRNGGAPHGPG